MFSNILLGPCPSLPVFPLELQERGRHSFHVHRQSEEIYQNLKVKARSFPPLDKTLLAINYERKKTPSKASRHPLILPGVLYPQPFQGIAPWKPEHL